MVRKDRKLCIKDNSHSAVDRCIYVTTSASMQSNHINHGTVVKVVFPNFPTWHSMHFSSQSGSVAHQRPLHCQYQYPRRLLVLILRSQRRFEWVEWRGLPSSATHLSELASKSQGGTLWSSMNGFIPKVIASEKRTCLTTPRQSPPKNQN